MTEPSEFVRKAAHRVVGSLSIVGPMSKHDLAANANASVETVQHALEWLRMLGAPIEFDRRGRVWTTQNRGWRIPVYELPRDILVHRLEYDARTWVPADGADQWTKSDRGVEWTLVVHRDIELAYFSFVGLSMLVWLSAYPDGAHPVTDATIMAWADWQILVHRAAAIQALGLEGDSE